MLTISFRYLLQNMDWLEEEIGEYDNDYLIIDCPGASCLLHTHSIYRLWPEYRTNRTVHTSSFLPNTGVKSQSDGAANLCCVSPGVAVYGR